MAYLFFLSGEHPHLARAEIECLFGTVKQLSSELVLLNANEIDLTKALRLGYTKSIGKLLRQETSLDDFTDLRLENSYKISLKVLLGESLSVQHLAQLLYEQQLNPVVDIFNPAHHYVFFKIDETLYATEEVYFNDDNPHLRRAHLKLHNHPTSMHPKLAKAMINLAGTQAFVDPFCGVGGLVIEGLLMGVNAFGSDINAELVNKANQNAKKIGVAQVFTKQDALALTEQIPAIVTDLPYGKNSFLTEDLLALYQKFFLLAQQLTTRLVIGVSKSTNLAPLLKHTSWQVQQEFSIYMHKSLTRNIVVLTC